MKKIITISIAIILFSAMSCQKEEFLKIINEPEATLWTSLNAFEMAVVTPLDMITSESWGGSPLGDNELYSMAAADIGGVPVAQASTNAAWDVFSYRLHRTTPIDGSRTGGEMMRLFGQMYNAINACNDALNFLAKNEEGGKKAFTEVSAGIYDATMPRMKAEIMFYRAWAYYTLAFWFCPPYDPAGANDSKLLPFKTSFSANPEELRAPTLGSTKEIYDFVISDLEAAKGLMPISYYSEGRPNYYAICGQLARVNFLMGNYTSAKAECDVIINSGKYTLQSDVMAAWTSELGIVSASEVMWDWVAVNSKGRNIGWFTIISKNMPWQSGRGVNWSFCGWIKFYMSYSMLKYIDWMADPQHGDFTETANALADKRYGSTWLRLEGYVPQGSMDKVVWQNKYQTTFNALTDPQVWCDKYYRGLTDGGNAKIPLMRVAEFYLTRAIINFNAGLKAEAAADLKVIRDRACPSLPVITAANITADDIHRERVKEIGDENGDRLMYLMALRQPLGLGDRNPSGSQGAIVNPPYSNFYFRIPEDEAKNNASYPSGWVQP